MEYNNKINRRLIRSGIQSSVDRLISQETLVQQEIIRGYNGINGAKGHKAISKSKINPAYKNQNIKQQSGFNAEINMVSDHNIQAIRRKSSVRAYRTDELGQVNDPTVDIVFMDEKTGERILGSGVQLKFRGKTGAENVKQFLTKKEFDKYRNQRLAIPSEQLEEAHRYLDKKIQEYTLQTERLKKVGDSEQIKKIIERKKRVESVKERLMDGGKQSEAIKNRLTPLRQHVKQRVQEAHYAGKQAAISSTAVNMVLTTPFLAKRLYTEEDYTLKDASIDLTKTTVSSALTSYIISGTTVFIQGQLGSSNSVLLKQMAKTNLTSYLATISIDIGKHVHRLTTDPNYRFINLITDTSEHLIGTLSAAFLTVAAKSVLPASTSAAVMVVPGMIGYAAGQYIVKELVRLNHEVKLAHEVRLEVEAFCIEMDHQLDLFADEMKVVYAESALDWKKTEKLMHQIKGAETTSSMNLSIIQLAKHFEIELRLTEFDDFNEMMSEPNIPFTL